VEVHRPFQGLAFCTVHLYTLLLIRHCIPSFREIGIISPAFKSPHLESIPRVRTSEDRTPQPAVDSLKVRPSRPVKLKALFLPQLSNTCEVHEHSKSRNTIALRKEISGIYQEAQHLGMALVQVQDAGMRVSLSETLRHRTAVLSIAVSLHAVTVQNAAIHQPIPSMQHACKRF